MMEFTFEIPAWEQVIGVLQPGEKVSALKLLALLEGEDEEMVREALDALEEKGAVLDPSDLPGLPASGSMALRLRQEAQLVESGLLPGGLEPNDPLRLYLEELTAMSPEGDEKALAAEYLRGNEVAGQTLAALCLRRVVELAEEFAGKGVLLMDLIQEGSMGLWQGILHYTGGDFAACRDQWIRHALHRAIFLQTRSGDLGQKLRQGMEDYRDVDQRLLGELGRNPTLEELADAMHVTVEEAVVYANMLTMARTRQQVEEAMKPRQAQPEDELAVEDTAYFQLRQRIMELLSTLPEKDARVLTLRFGLEGGLPLSPEETGRKLGMTSREVTETEENALAKLRRQK